MSGEPKAARAKACGILIFHNEKCSRPTGPPGDCKCLGNRGHRSEIWRYIGERAGRLDCVASGSDINTSRGLRMLEHLPGSSAKFSPRIFETRNLPLAAYLISGRHLRYAGLHVEDGRGIFTFDDPSNQGPMLEAEFHSGGECPATLFHSVVKRLRREIDEAIAQARSGR